MKTAQDLYEDYINGTPVPGHLRCPWVCLPQGMQDFWLQLARDHNEQVTSAEQFARENFDRGYSDGYNAALANHGIVEGP